MSLAGVTAQLLLSFGLLALYWKARAMDHTHLMLFEYRHAWFASLNIGYHVGVDGISVAMMLLTAFIMEAAVLVSWKVERMTKEYCKYLVALTRANLPGVRQTGQA